MTGNEHRDRILKEIDQSGEWFTEIIANLDGLGKVLGASSNATRIETLTSAGDELIELAVPIFEKRGMNNAEIVMAALGFALAWVKTCEAEDLKEN